MRNGLLSFADTFHFSDFYLINKTFTFKLFLSGNKFGFVCNICLSANKRCYWNRKWATKTLDFQTSWNLRISALEPEPSSLFWLHTSVDVASNRPASWFNQFVFSEKFCMKGLFFAHRGHFQALKVRDLKLLCLSQLCVLKYWIINVLLAFYKSNWQMLVFWSHCRTLYRLTLYDTHLQV